MGVSMTTPQKALERQNLKRKMQLSSTSQNSADQHQIHYQERQYQCREVFVNKYPTIIEERDEGLSRGSELLQIHKNKKENDHEYLSHQGPNNKNRSQLGLKESISSGNLKIQTHKQIQPSIIFGLPQDSQKLSSNIQQISKKQCQVPQKQSIEKIQELQNNEKNISSQEIKCILKTENQQKTSKMLSYTSLHPSKTSLPPIQEERVSLTASSLTNSLHPNKVNPSQNTFQPLKIINSYKNTENQPMIIKSNPIKKQLHLVALSTNQMSCNFEKIKNQNCDSNGNQSKNTQMNNFAPQILENKANHQSNAIKIEYLQSPTLNQHQKNQANTKAVCEPQERHPAKRKVRLIRYDDLF